MPSKIPVFQISSLANFFSPQRKNNYRPNLLHPDHLLVLGFMAVGFFALIQTVRFFPTLHNSVLGFQSSITIEEVVAHTNQKRQEQGLPPLTVNTQLSAAALAKAQDMLDNQYWAHTSPTGKKPWDFIKSANYHYKVAGENLARDFSHTNDMMSAWMDSPTHRANILNDRYEQIGVALVYGKLEGFDTALVVQMFGAPVSGTAQVGDGTVSEDTSQTSSAPAHNPVLAIDQSDSAEPEPAAALPPGDRQSTGQKQTETVIQTSSNDQAINLADSQDNLVTKQAVQPARSGSPIFTPLELTKVIFLAVVMMVILTLVYDSIVIGNKKNMRLVGENLGHIILFISVAFLMIIFKGGFLR
jgi:hypothetical protein